LELGILTVLYAHRFIVFMNKHKIYNFIKTAVYII